MNTIKYIQKFIPILLLITFAVGCGVNNPSNSENSSRKFPVNDTVFPVSDLEKRFTYVQDSIQTSIYWYWMSDNMSVAGVEKDLEAMKKVGINRVFIGNIWQNDVKAGKVKIFSEEWWTVLHAALKKATQLNIEVGIFNSPGWSQSGGPWIKPTQAMRYLKSTEIHVKGPLKLSTLPDKAHSQFQDVKLIAYPAEPSEKSSLSGTNALITSSPAQADVINAFDRDLNTGITIRRGQPFEITVSSKAAHTINSFKVVPKSNTLWLNGEILASVNGQYKLIKSFRIDRSNETLAVGFSPKAPAVIALPEVKSTRFKIRFNSLSDGEIAELELTSQLLVEQYAEKTLAKMWPNPFPNWSSYLWPQAIPESSVTGKINPDKVIDLTTFIQPDGNFKWDVPAGDWIIERIGMTPTQVTNSPASVEATGPEVDKMSTEHVKSHFNEYMGQILKRIPAEDRKSWKVVVQDSYETGGQNWTDGFLKQFTEVYGYNAVPYLPVVQGKVVGSRDISDRFLWDLRRLIADNVAYKYVGGLKEISHANGLTTWLENYGHWGFPGEFLQYGGQSDEIGGEFWAEGNLGNIENKAASSAAHIYGKIKVSAESFTAGEQAYVRYPAMLKKRGDRFFTEGINNTLLHVYIQQPYEERTPGINTNFGTEFNRKNTWFYDMDIFLQYLKRTNMMLQQGHFVADVAYFIGEDAPKMTGIEDPKFPQGYSFDYINADVIINRLSVKDGKLVLPDGMHYRMLVLPKLTTMRPELLGKIKELVAAGAVVWGLRPESSPSLQHFPHADDNVKAISTELWGNTSQTKVINKYGKGLVINGLEIAKSLKAIHLEADCKISPVNAKDNILFTHRTLIDGTQIYFLSNQEDHQVEFSAAFRTTGFLPQLYNPVDGSIRNLPIFELDSTHTNIPLKLAPAESAFIVFSKSTNQYKSANESKGVANHGVTNYPLVSTYIPLNNAWTLQFDEAARGPKKPVILDTLKDWTAMNNDSVRYYSGTAVYKTNVRLSTPKHNAQVYLNLGMVKVLAKVKINGKEVGGVWTPPYRINVTSAVKTGVNKIEIKVVNTWVNRLIGDSMLPEAERKTSLDYNPYNPKSPLQPSGLLGPVTFEYITY